MNRRNVFGLKSRQHGSKHWIIYWDIVKLTIEEEVKLVRQGFNVYFYRQRNLG